MHGSVRIGLTAGITFLGVGVMAASVPRALAPAAGGLWEVSKSANGHDPTRVCVPSPEVLAQFEHRAGRCTRSVIRDSGSNAEINYNCADGGFGRSAMTLVTPRSLTIDTQGISGGLPFHYKLYARRMGDCRP
jgi:Protein of unknown function (DUF3617)